MKKEEKTLKKNLVYDGKIMRVYNDDVLAANNIKTTREIIVHKGGVCVLAVVDGKIPLVKQYRYAFGKEMYELPAGKLETNENPYEAGLRELEEEVGLKAESLTSFGFIYPSPGYTNEIDYFYVANKVTKTERHLDPDEDIDVTYFSLEKLLEMIESNEINDAKTISLILKYNESIK